MRQETKEAHVYFPVKVLNGLKKLAEQNRRSVSAEIVIAVEKHIDESRTNDKMSK
jgi:hypothetical protein